MIAGEVNSRLEAILDVVVHDASGVGNEFPAILDTGFGGFLTLPSSAIRTFELRSLGRQRGILADGTRAFFDVFSGSVEWDGRKRAVEIHAADAEPLVGMKLLDGYQLKINVRQGGRVEIEEMAD
jgi:clan AA aspartic protease